MTNPSLATSGRRVTDKVAFVPIPPALAKVFWTLVTLFLGWLATSAWSGKESTADHQTDMQAVRGDIQRVLDVVCLSAPQNARQCKP